MGQEQNEWQFVKQPYGLTENANLHNSNNRQGNMMPFNQNMADINNSGEHFQYNNYGNEKISVKNQEIMNHGYDYDGELYRSNSTMSTPMIQTPLNQVPATHYGQLNMFRFNPQESKVFGNNQSNFSVSPHADISVNTVQCVKTQNVHPVALGGKLAETPSGGSLYLGQASVQSQNGHMQVQDNTITTVEKIFGSATTESSESETWNKRYTSDNASKKFTVDEQKKISSFGSRIFTGSVEKILNWHQTLSAIEIEYVFEVIGKCLNIRNGQGCEKIILMRDSSGPVLQVIYYEIDYLLPDIAIGCTIRVVGKMIGKNRMMGFKIRQGYDSEIAALPHLSAIGHHVITKMQVVNFQHQ